MKDFGSMFWVFQFHVNECWLFLLDHTRVGMIVQTSLDIYTKSRLVLTGIKSSDSVSLFLAATAGIFDFFVLA